MKRRRRRSRSSRRRRRRRSRIVIPSITGMRVSYVLSRKGRKEEEEEEKECDISDHLGDSAYQLDQVKGGCHKKNP